MRQVVPAPAAGVVEGEGSLLVRSAGRDRVDRAPREHVLRRAAGGVVEHRLALGIDDELDAGGVAVDQLRGVRGVDAAGQGEQAADEDREPAPATRGALPTRTGPRGQPVMGCHGRRHVKI